MGPERIVGRKGTTIVASQTVQAIMFATLAVLPAFLTGSMAVKIRADFLLGPAALGFAIAWFFIVSSLSTALLAKGVDGATSRTSIAYGLSLSSASLLGVASSRSAPMLLLALTVGGIGNAVLQPAVNALLSRRIPRERLGFAFGVKQSAIPMATLVGGLAVPTLGVILGWRGTFAVTGVVAGTVAFFVWSFGNRAELIGVRARRSLLSNDTDVRSLILFSIAGMFAAGAGTALGAFLVDAAVGIGILEWRAGLIAAGASAGGLITRVVMGWFVDHNQIVGRYRLITLLVLLGIPGFLLLATGAPALYFVGALLAYSAGWGWTGIFHYTVVSQNPKAPARATGIIQTGMSLGGGLGPIVIGSVAQSAGYAAGWLAAAMLGVAGAVFFVIGDRRFNRRLIRLARPTQLDPSVWAALAVDLEVGRPRIEPALDLQHVAYRYRVIRIGAGETWQSPNMAYRVSVAALGAQPLTLVLGSARFSLSIGDVMSLPPHLPWSVHACGSQSGKFAVLPIDGDDET